MEKFHILENELLQKWRNFTVSDVMLPGKLEIKGLVFKNSSYIVIICGRMGSAMYFSTFSAEMCLYYYVQNIQFQLVRTHFMCIINNDEWLITFILLYLYILLQNVSSLSYTSKKNPLIIVHLW